MGIAGVFVDMLQCQLHWQYARIDRCNWWRLSSLRFVQMAFLQQPIAVRPALAPSVQGWKMEEHEKQEEALQHGGRLQFVID